MPGGSRCYAYQGDDRHWTAVCTSVRFSVGRRDCCAPADSPRESGKPSRPVSCAYPGGDFTTMAESAASLPAPAPTGRRSTTRISLVPHPVPPSVHGYWKRVSGTCPSTANVDTYLQAYWCDQYGCRWITVASDSGDVRRRRFRQSHHREKDLLEQLQDRWLARLRRCRSQRSRRSAGYTYSPAVNLTCTP
jgi:hypothetical protein